MKVKSLLLLGFAASMTFVACDKNESELGGTDSAAPKSVTINLANVAPATRSAGGEVLTANNNIQLNSYQIFFTDGTNVYQAKQADGTTPADQYFDGTSSVPTEGSYHFLPAAVNKVILIGNHDKIEVTYVDGKATAPNFDLALAIEDEQDATALTLYDESALTAKTPEHTDGNPLYEATLEPTPRVARLFVKSFNCEFSQTALYNKLDLGMLALNNYYEVSTLAENTVGTLNNITVTAENVWDWLAGKVKGEFDNDVFEGEAATDPYNTGAISLTPSDPSKTGVNLYYHVFAGTTVPQLVLRAVGDNAPLYLPTLRFVDEESNEITDWEAGMIYEMDFNFADTDFSQPDKCIDITVTPVKWAVTTVTPEYK